MLNPLEHHPYFKQEILLTTKHEKATLIAPVFQSTLEMLVLEHAADTDLLGTFSGEVERQSSARQTAIEKAKIGLRETGRTLGLASEGTIGADPEVGFLNSDIEVLVLVDLARGIEIVEQYRSFEITAARIVSKPGEDLTDFYRQSDFPNHRLIVRPNKNSKPISVKGLSELDNLRAAIEVCAAESEDGLVVIESDLRALYSPSRQRNITAVAKLLATRVLAQCPDCRCPGWGKVGVERGLNCATCGTLSESAAAREIYGCVSCQHQELGEPLAEFASPSQCQQCNP